MSYQQSTINGVTGTIHCRMINNFILSFLPIKELNKYFIINKWFHNKLNPLFQNVTKIQKCYKNNRLDLDNNFKLKKNINYTKNQLIRYLLTYYPSYLIYLFPERLINYTRKTNLLTWLQKNTPKNIHERTKRHVKNLLLLNSISSKEILSSIHNSIRFKL